MSSFMDKKAAAKAAPREYRDVDVSFDQGFAKRRDDLEAQIVGASADRRLASDPAAELRKELDELVEQERDSLVTLRFYRVPGDEWTNLTAVNPARPGAVIDLRYGYNMHAVCKASAPEHGRVIDDGAELSQSPEEWDEIWDLLAGSDMGRVVDAIFDLNEWEPANRIERLKKASAGIPASEANSDSPENSGSLTDD